MLDGKVQSYGTAAMTRTAYGASPRSSVGAANPQPSIVASILFFLLFSGPPKFRERDLAASLRGDIDAVVIFHVLVWVAAGLWVFFQMRFYFQTNSKSLGLRLPQKLGLGMVATLGLSTFVSVAPSLTAFMVYQMFISLMFTTVFVELYGVEACLQKLFQSSAILCAAIAAAFFFMPDLVVVTTETKALRLRGDFLGGTEGNALLCLVLLLAGVQKLSKITYGLVLGLSCILLVASLSRTAYLALFSICLLVALKRPDARSFRRFALIFGVAAAVIFALGLATRLNEYRDPESISTLSDRVGLWTYLSGVTVRESPLLGLGYYSASRVYGPRYNPELATAHSMFVETFAGGGLLALTVLVILCLAMSVYAVRVFRQDSTLSFTVTILFLLTIMFGFIGATLDSGSVAITFWSVAASLPILRKRELALSRLRLIPQTQQAEVL